MPKRRFQPAQIAAIKASPETSGKLADELGVSTSTICKIRNGWTYKKVNHDPLVMGVRSQQKDFGTKA
jgi:hypothetical protein